ncbi:sugar phosphate isomerase family [Malacoplasma iowae]|uniref:NagB-related protein n=1 Tax=Malacoplasma iowae DK-CPA TaxID=1394179 RepID=A0A084U3G2_MALIO|nr:hypothetical protein [Malacoplasma iowae]KFB07498.1 NagB-related protein [Malacoplasma iowae DK-CPA]WPL37209.1 hypothetical protein QX179_01865 [Malacoplasma iowae]WPL37674.1 hypothetical protein QX182_04200 [Malacoplasma iowae]WPL39616.1 hypothetical protein QX183_03650 [Malacoplasma iowae]WPL40761.1 hypothetical protein QX184_04480 [Malacoplasma iowae]
MAVVIKSCKNIKQLNKKIIKDIKKILSDKPSSRIGFYWDESLSEIFNALVKTKKIQWFSSRIVPIVEYKDDQTLMFEDILKNHFIDKIDISQGNYASLKDRINKLSDNGNLNDLYKFSDGLDLVIFGIDKRGNFLFNDFESKIDYINYANNGNQLISPGIKSIMLAKQIICIVIDEEADNIVRIINDKKIDKDDIITLLNFHNNITLFTTNNIIKKKEINKEGLSEEYTPLYEELFSETESNESDNNFKFSNDLLDDKVDDSTIDEELNDEDEIDSSVEETEIKEEKEDLLDHLDDLVKDEEPTQEELEAIENELNNDDVEIINSDSDEYDSLSLSDVDVIETEIKDDIEDETIQVDEVEIEEERTTDEEFEDDLSHLKDSLEQDDDFGVEELETIDTVEIPQEIKSNALNEEDLEILRLKEVQRILEEELKNLEESTQEFKKIDQNLNNYIDKSNNIEPKYEKQDEVVILDEIKDNSLNKEYIVEEKHIKQETNTNKEKDLLIDEIVITEKDININPPVETVTIIKEDDKPLEIIDETKPDNQSQTYIDKNKSEQINQIQSIIDNQKELEKLYDLTYQPRTIKRDYVITNPKTKEQIQRIIDIKEDALRMIEQLIIKNRLDQKTLTEKDLPNTQSEFYKVKYIPGNRPTPMLMLYNEPNEQVYSANVKRMIDTYKILINNKSFNSSNKHFWNIGSYVSFNEQTNEVDLIAFEHFDTLIFLLRAINRPLYFFVKKETAAILTVLASKFNNELLVLKMS